MRDPNLPRNELDAVAENWLAGGLDPRCGKIRQQEERRKVLQVETESLQAERTPDRSLLVLLKARGEILSHFVRKLTN